MDFSQSQYPVLTNIANQRNGLPNSRYLTSQYMPAPATTSSLRNLLELNEPKNVNQLNDPKTTTNNVLQTSQLRPSTSLSKPVSKIVTEDNDDEDYGDFKFTPKSVFRFTRDFVSKHPIGFMVVVIIISALLYIIYVQQHGGNITDLMLKYGLWNKEDIERFSGGGKETNQVDDIYDNQEENGNDKEDNDSDSDEYETDSDDSDDESSGSNGDDDDDKENEFNSIPNFNNLSTNPFLLSSFPIPQSMAAPSFVESNL